MTTITAPSGVAYRSGQNCEVRTYLYAASAVAQNTVIQMVPVYRNEIIMDVVVDFDALGASTAIEVGDGNSATRFVGSTVTTSAGNAHLAGTTARGYQYTVDDTIDVTVSGTGAATGNIRVTVFLYRVY